MKSANVARPELESLEDIEEGLIAKAFAQRRQLLKNMVASPGQGLHFGHEPDIYQVVAYFDECSKRAQKLSYSEAPILTPHASPAAPTAERPDAQNRHLVSHPPYILLAKTLPVSTSSE